MQRIVITGNERDQLISNAVKGAIAGAVGVWLMDRLDWFMFERVDARARQRTEAVRPGGLDPTHVAANRAAHAAGTTLAPAQPHPAGVALHYALGIGPAAVYAATRERFPVRRAGEDHLYGLGLGLGLFLVMDETLGRLTGLTAAPRAYPWQAHARGLAAHLVLGLATNMVLNLLHAPRPMPQSALDRTRLQREETAPIFSPAKPDSAGVTLH